MYHYATIICLFTPSTWRPPTVIGPGEKGHNSKSFAFRIKKQIHHLKEEEKLILMIIRF